MATLPNEFSKGWAVTLSSWDSWALEGIPSLTITTHPGLHFPGSLCLGTCHPFTPASNKEEYLGCTHTNRWILLACYIFVFSMFSVSLPSLAFVCLTLKCLSVVWLFAACPDPCLFLDYSFGSPCIFLFAGTGPYLSDYVFSLKPAFGSSSVVTPP